MSSKNKSFTLIELLVVIVIIGILAGVIIISTSSSINKTHDSVRVYDLGVLSRGLFAHDSINGSYPTLTCRIGDSGCLTNLVPEYFSALPLDPVSGNYSYSSTGSEFMVMAKASDGPIVFTDSGSNKSIVFTSYYYNFKNKLRGDGGNPSIAVNDFANGALWGYVNKFTVGWTSRLDMLSSTVNYGFEEGDYDIYIRVRTDGLGGTPNSLPFVIYNWTHGTFMHSVNITGLSTSYQVKYVGRISISEANLSENVYANFSTSGVTTNYYLDYVEFRKV